MSIREAEQALEETVGMWSRFYLHYHPDVEYMPRKTAAWILGEKRASLLPRANTMYADSVEVSRVRRSIHDSEENAKSWIKNARAFRSSQMKNVTLDPFGDNNDNYIVEHNGEPAGTVWSEGPMLPGMSYRAISRIHDGINPDVAPVAAYGTTPEEAAAAMLFPDA